MIQVYDTAKKVAGKLSESERLAKNKEGKTITKIHEQRTRMVENFGELLKRLPPMNPADIETAHTNLTIHVALITIEKNQGGQQANEQRKGNQT